MLEKREKSRKIKSKSKKKRKPLDTNKVNLFGRDIKSYLYFT